ncbi:MAG TPA: amino acid permease [Candidatus Solibacter sp.]|jgi:basic amino acid/polyamine antiporter, APA family|nr:amino acid permease [Candidatus Solibacter sp.]
MPTSQMQSARPGLLRQLGFFSATALVISNMVGTGIFTTTGFMAADLGSAGLILACWSVGALFALAGALSYSELGINFPSSGGEYVYLTHAFGPEWGFMTGWVSFFAGFSAPIAAAALAFADYLGYFFPALKQANARMVVGSGAFSLHLGAGQAVASALIAAFTVLNCLGVGRTAKVQNVLTSTKLIVIAGFVAIGFIAGSGSWTHFSEPAVRTSAASLPTQFIVSLLYVMVGYSGWNAATYVAEELRRPERTLPAALGAGTALVAALYLGLNLIFIYSTPLESMKGVIAIGSLAASNLFGPHVAGAFSALMAISLVSTVNAMVTVGPRVYYAMAKNRAFFHAAATVDPRSHTPVNAIVSQGLCAMLMTLTPFRNLLIYIGMSLTLFTVLSVAALFVFRRRRPDWQKLRALQFAWPLIPASYILVGACMMIYGVVQQPGASLTALATVGAGALVYRFGVHPASRNT